MPSQNDIALNLVAKLDQGSVQSEAGQMAQNIARSIEQAFEGVGQKIADALVKGTQNATKQIVDPTGQVIGGMTPPPIAGQNPLQAFRGGFVDPYSAPNMGALLPRSGIDQNLINQSLGGVITGASPSDAFGRAATADFATSQARLLQSMKKAGMGVELGEEEKEFFKGAQETGRDTLRLLHEQMRLLGEELKNSIKETKLLEESMKTVSDTEKETTRQKLEEERTKTQNIQQSLNQVAAQGQAASQGVQAAGEMLGGGGGRMSRIGGALGGLAPVLGELGQLPYAYRASRVAGAENEQLLGRAGMRGDFEKAIAIEQMGGEGAVRRQGGMEALMGIGGNLLATAGAAMSTPFTGGMGVAGAGIFGARSLQGILGFEGERQRSIEDQVSKYQQENAFFFDTTSRGRGMAVDAFRTAQAMGAPEASGAFMGMGTTTLGGAPMNLRQYGLEQGLSPEMMQGVINRSMGAMGGTFFGQAPSVTTNMQAELARLQGVGLGNAPELSGALMQTGMGRGESIERVKEVFTDAVSAGVDRARLGRTMEIFAQQSAQMGMGGGKFMEREMGRALGAAQDVFGPNIEGYQMDMTQRVLERSRQFTGGTGGLGAVAGTMAVQGMEKKFGVNLSAAQERMLQMGDVTPEGLQKMLGVDEGRAKEMSEYLNQQKIKEERSTTERVVGKEGFQLQQFEKMKQERGGRLTLEEYYKEMEVRGGLEEGKVADLGRGVTPSGDITGKRAGIEELTRAAKGAPGRDIADAMSTIDTAKIVTGFNTLGNQLPIINKTVDEFIMKLNESLGKMGVAGTGFQSSFFKTMGGPLLPGQPKK